MPFIWWILFHINQLNQSNDLGIGVAELAHVYDLSTFHLADFLLNLKPNKSPLILKSKDNDEA